MSSNKLPEKIQRGREAAKEILPALFRTLTSPDGQLHAATVLAAAAWLTGTSLYRSIHPEDVINTGTILKSEKINREWESLIHLFETYNFGKADIPAGRLILAALAAGDEHKPGVGMEDVQRELEPQYHAAMRKHGFDYGEGANAGVVLCSILHRYFASDRKEIDPVVSAGIITQSILEGATTAPPPLQSPG